MIEVNNLGFSYKNGDWVFNDYSFCLGKNEIMAVIGPNGRGKTTLLKILAGFLKPTVGTVKTNCEFSVVHQYSHTPFSYTVMDMVLMGRARHLGVFSSPGKKDWEIAGNALDHFGLSDFKDEPFHQLSGGERQLVLIARAVASGCNCLLLDEPASALDFKNQDIVLKTLRDLAREKEMSILFTTHYPQHAIHIADRVLMMHSRKTCTCGKTLDLMTDEALNRLYGIQIRNITYEHLNTEIHTVVPIFS